MSPTIREATTADIEPAVRALVEAFAEYPFTRHTIAADNHLERLARAQHLLLTRVGLPYGRVWVSDDLNAVSVWTTPASWPGAGTVFAELAPELADIAGERASVAEATEAALSAHRPRTPTWFLSTVGVRPDQQGRGLGRAVIEPGLRAADSEGSATYLETSLESNVALYRKFGFQVIAEIDLPEQGPKTWCMRREPAARNESSPVTRS